MAVETKRSIPTEPKIKPGTDTVHDAAVSAAATPSPMTTPVPAKSRPLVRPGEELWEITTGGTVHVVVTDDRGRTVTRKVGGGPGSRLRIKTVDRMIVQENIRRDGADPFRNGKLIRIDVDQNTDPDTTSIDALNPAALMDLFGVTGPDFQDIIAPLGELTLRRMKAMVDNKVVDATSTQAEVLIDALATRYPISSGDTEVYREMQQLKEVAAPNAGAGGPAAR